MKRILPSLVVGALALVAIGCSSADNGDKPGYSKEDFAKRPPPPGYGPAGAAPANPPAGAGK